MSLLQDMLKEMAADGAVGAHAVAAAPGSLFGGGAVRRKKKKKVKEAYRLDPSEVAMPTNRNVWNWRVIGEMMEMGKGQREETAFDPADVLSKLDAAETRVKAEDDTVPFGLEDEDGNLVKVYVRAEQADEFESTLAAMLAGEDVDEDEDGYAESAEIAEILFELKDKFDIVDVEWPQIEGDEEEEQALEGGDEEMGGEGEDSFMDAIGGDEEMGGEGDMEGLEDMEGEGDLEGDMEMEPEGGAESALQQVIDMMKADAEARKAESEARAEEAKARTAEANANAAGHKVKQEEQVLDMETYNEQKKTEEEEAKQLAKLAKWKHDQAQSAETKMAEEEESIRQEREINQHQETQPISVQSLADELIRRLQGSIR
jgi:hypothetical protein